VPEATQGDQIERVADRGDRVFVHRECLAAQGELIDQDDTGGRILSLSEENHQAQARAEAMGLSRAQERTGMSPPALVVTGDDQTICL
jgi:hypothetical protein